MVVKKSKGKDESDLNIEKAVERGIEKGIKNSVNKVISKHKKCESDSDHIGGLIYLLGFIGALIHFIPVSVGFWGFVLAILKSLVWPVFIVLKILGS